MDFPAEQVEELKGYCETLSSFREEGLTFFRMGGLALPAPCSPTKVDAIFQPTEGNGYKSRMYYGTNIQTPVAKNWNLQKRLNEENWNSFSWTIETEGKTLAQVLVDHLSALVRR